MWHQFCHPAAALLRRKMLGQVEVSGKNVKWTYAAQGAYGLAPCHLMVKHHMQRRMRHGQPTQDGSRVSRHDRALCHSSIVSPQDAETNREPSGENLTRLTILKMALQSDVAAPTTPHLNNQFFVP